jgi:hypothetical protein
MHDVPKAHVKAIGHLLEQPTVPIGQQVVAAAKVELVIGVPPAVGERGEHCAVGILEVRPVPVQQLRGQRQRRLRVLGILLCKRCLARRLIRGSQPTCFLVARVTADALHLAAAERWKLWHRRSTH